LSCSPGYGKYIKISNPIFRSEATDFQKKIVNYIFMFKNRKDAGLRLARLMFKFHKAKDTIVLALPRGGVIIGAILANEFSLPFDILASGKIGAPGNKEFAIGAVSENGILLLDRQIINLYQISNDYLKYELEKTMKELKRRSLVYRSGRPAINIKNKTVILVDDGVATGLTMTAAIESVKSQGAIKVITAIPVGAEDALQRIKTKVDEIFCLSIPSYFGAVGSFYENFEQINDEEIVNIFSIQSYIKQ